MSKIDFTKPIELTDGTPVELLSSTYDELSIQIPRDHRHGGQRFFNRRTGTGVYVSSLKLRNRVAFTVGTTVYFRDGRTGVVVAMPTQFGTSYVQAAVVGGNLGVDTFKAVLAYENGLQSNDGSWESDNDFATSADAFKPKVTFTYRNVYQNGTAGSTAHKSLDVAKFAAKVGKTRVGILKIGTDGSAELLKCVPSKRSSGFEVATWTDA